MKLIVMWKKGTVLFSETMRGTMFECWKMMREFKKRHPGGKGRIVPEVSR
jgi:hypothetical protein